MSTPPPPPPPPPPPHAGWVHKEGHVRRSWKRRWFKLDAGFLTYSTSDVRGSLLGLVPLAGARLLETPPTTKHVYTLLVGTSPTTKTESFARQPKRPLHQQVTAAD